MSVSPFVRVKGLIRFYSSGAKFAPEPGGGGNRFGVLYEKSMA